MRPETAAVLGPVLRDWDSSGISYRVQEDWVPPRHHPYTPPRAETVAMVWTPDGSGTGVLIGAPGAPVTADELLAAVDALQDAVVEDRLLGTTTWPPCPLHPGTHPLVPRLHHTVVWACPRTGEVICRVGELGSAVAGPTPG